MKNKTIKLVALLAVLSVAAVSCQKENVDLTTTADIVADNQAVYIYQYEVNGIRSRITLRGEAERADFINRMLALAKEGYTVRFFNEARFVQLQTKEVETYSTKDKDKAYKWVSDMSEAGYEVSVTYDEKTGYYNCTATK